MDAYLVYMRKVQYLNQTTSTRMVLMPVGACISHQAVIRIARVDFQKPETSITEQEWKEYFMAASFPDKTRLPALGKAMSNLRMATNNDGNTRVDKLIYDFMGLLDEYNMEGYDIEEPSFVSNTWSKQLGQRL